ncbi:DUF4082 domain-containing protein [Amycolatopsis minnesotensis]|uniref:DUF4082 domain-containing protein n=1 Tax=Amycolatopsis minnesotensis TaxID=337894 RepID=A0ABN2Q6J7_9PSEU
MRTRNFLVAIPTVLALAGATLAISAATPTSAPVTESLWPNASPSVASDADSGSVELGVRFTSAVPGRVTGVRFYKGPSNTGEHIGSLWSADGVRLATVAFRDETASGWQHALFEHPVAIAANTPYVASYHAPRGGYSGDQGYFRGYSQFSGNLTAPKSGPQANGVFSYGRSSKFPTQSYRDSNYFVDVFFQADPNARPQPASPVPSVSAKDTLAKGVELPRVPWEGGPAYYAANPGAKAWGDPAFFPTAVWFESVLGRQDVETDKAAGLNTYIELTNNSDPALLRANGMAAIAADLPGSGSERVGALLADEVDMWAGPGSGAWTGNYPGQGEVCAVRGCGYTVLKTLSDQLKEPDARLRFANFGKGVLFWESDAEAEKFVNGYTTAVSNDVYWYTDPNVCTSSSEGPSLGVVNPNCRLAANYGLTVDRMRALDAKDGKLQPVFGFVETGHPFTDAASPTITGPQLEGAVMNSLIHEARGIIYFNHSFGGPCVSQHVLRDPCGAAVRPSVTKMNERIRQLAPILNTQSFQYSFAHGMDTMLKSYDGSYYVFAMLGRGTSSGKQVLNLPAGMAGSRASVLFEDREVPVVDGTLTDEFAAEYSYHVYRITP